MERCKFPFIDGMSALGDSGVCNCKRVVKWDVPYSRLKVIECCKMKYIAFSLFSIKRMWVISIR